MKDKQTNAASLKDKQTKGNHTKEGQTKVTLWERYLTREIGIEFKACLYFFAVLFFYSVFRICTGRFEAGILHMAEMIFSCYVIGYLQVYVFWDFDEADALGKKELFGMAFCTVLYTGLSFFLKWFDGKLSVSLGFAAYMIVSYVCVFLIYKSKRTIDDKKLNEDLRLFQSEHEKVQDTEE